MKATKLVLLGAVAVLFLAFSLSSCSKKDDGPSETPGQLIGFGDSNDMPQGTPYQLPAGISMVDTMHGDECDTVYRVGSGYYVKMCAGLYNSGSNDVELLLPGGLICVASDRSSYQNGLLLQATKIILKAKKVTNCSILTYCTNAGKHAASDNMYYTFGPVTNSTLIQELVTLVKNKKINVSDYPAGSSDYSDVTSTLQGAVWDITDGRGLSDGHRSEIQQIPNK